MKTLKTFLSFNESVDGLESDVEVIKDILDDADMDCEVEITDIPVSFTGRKKFRDRIKVISIQIPTRKGGVSLNSDFSDLRDDSVLKFSLHPIMKRITELTGCKIYNYVRSHRKRIDKYLILYLTRPTSE